MFDIEEVAAHLDNFKNVVESRTSFSPSVALATLEEMKVLITKCRYLSYDSRSQPIFNRLLFREILELGVILCVRTANETDIEDLNSTPIRSFYQQLKFFYFENEDLPQSARMFTIIVVNLLAVYSTKSANEEEKRLLIAEFQTDLAQVEIQYANNIYVQFIVEVEQAVSNNKLTRIIELQKVAPSMLFEPFMAKLVVQVKKNLCKDICTQCEMEVSGLVRILKMQNEEQCREFLEKQDAYIIDENNKVILKIKAKETTLKTPIIRQDEVIRSAKQFNDL